MLLPLTHRPVSVPIAQLLLSVLCWGCSETRLVFPCAQSTCETTEPISLKPDAGQGNNADASFTTLLDEKPINAGIPDAATPPAIASCPSLPPQFLLQGCERSLLCQLQQQGDKFQAYCDDQLLTGQCTGDGQLHFELPSGQTCLGAIRNDQITAECNNVNGSESNALGSNTTGNSCNVSWKTNLLASPGCVKMPTVESLEVCGVQALGCTWLANSCSVQAVCNGGQLVLHGELVGDRLSVQTDTLRCSGVISGDFLEGNCTRGDDSQCSFQMNSQNSGASGTQALDCPGQWPTPGFSLSGCEREGSVCHLRRRDCLWEIACGNEVYGGQLATSTDPLRFTSQLGANCTAQVTESGLAGDCEWGSEYCQFTQVTPPERLSCAPLPPELRLEYCGKTTACQVVQNGCQWQALCQQNALRISGSQGLAGPLDLAIGAATACTLSSAASGWGGECAFAQRNCGSANVAVLTALPTSSEDLSTSLSPLLRQAHAQ